MSPTRTRIDHPHGTVVLVEIDGADATHLPTAERRLAESFGPVRRRTFVAGRAAARAGLAFAGIDAPAIVVGPRGEPSWEGPVSISISHKDDVAGAIVRARAGRCDHVGIDLERVRPPRVDIAARVLTDDEHLEHRALPEDEQGAYLLETFSVKEAIYKAIHPMLQRYVGFREVALVRSGDDVAVLHAFVVDGARLSIRASTRRIETASGPMILSTALAWIED